MSNQYLEIAAIVGFLAFLIVGTYYDRLQKRKRTQALSQVAEQMGFASYPKGDEAFLAALPDFCLFSRGYSRKLTNLMRGTFGDVGIAIFDYTYIIRGGRSSHTRLQTVICFELPGLVLPAFSLQPESVLDKLGARLGKQDVDFIQYPDFSAKYKLQGENAEAIRSIFTDRVLYHYETSQGLYTEGNDNRLLLYRYSVRLKPEEIRAFVEEGMQVLASFYPAVLKVEDETLR